MNKKTFLPFLSLVIISLSLLISKVPTFSPALPAETLVKAGPSVPSCPPNPSLIPTSHFSPPPTTLIAVGDVMLGRYCNMQMLNPPAGGKDWRYPFLKTADLTSSADITFGNLEAPLIENCPATSTSMIFCGRPEAVEGLKFAGFDVLSLANNHILNYGQKGLEQTQKILKDNEILFSCSSYSPCPSDPSVIFKNGLLFGFLSFDLVTYPHLSPLSHISLISPTVDILIVSLHWGAEYQKEPTEEQIKLAHQIIDSGAKVIIGHHPHVTQSTEEYNGGLIFYSLGNFVFDQPWSEETKRGQVAEIIFEGKDIKSYKTIPIYIQDFCQPELLQ